MIRIKQGTRQQPGLAALALVLIAVLSNPSVAWGEPLLQVKGTATISHRCAGSDCQALESPFETTFEFFIDPAAITETQFGSTFAVEHFSAMLALRQEEPLSRKVKPLRWDSAGYVEDYDDGRRDQGNISMGYSDGVSTVSRTLLAPSGGLDPWEGFLFNDWHYRETVQSAQTGSLIYKGSAHITDVAPVPEPASLLLVGTGLAGLFVRRRVAGRRGRSAK